MVRGRMRGAHWGKPNGGGAGGGHSRDLETVVLQDFVIDILPTCDGVIDPSGIVLIPTTPRTAGMPSTMGTLTTISACQLLLPGSVTESRKHVLKSAALAP